MSLIVTVSTPEGIVMASDSRTTLSKPITASNEQNVNQLIELSDSTYKTFMFNDHVGISTCGAASVNGKAISAHIENIRIQNADNEMDVLAVTDKLSKYFSKIPGCPEVLFHIAGYDVCGCEKVLTCKRMGVGGGKNYCKDIPTLGVSWDGETSTMSRIMKAGFLVGQGNSRRIGTITINSVVDDKPVQEELKDRIIIPGYAPWHPDLDVEWQFFTLQDGIDFAKYAIRTTIDTMRFQSVPKTVGGPIDILVISPTGSKWIAHKELHA